MDYESIPLETRQKIMNSLIFEQSDVWDAVLIIVNKALKSESDFAISAMEEQKRAHQCGRADGILYIKDLLESTRSEALNLSGRK